MGTVIREKENMQQIYSDEANSYDCIGCNSQRRAYSTRRNNL